MLTVPDAVVAVRRDGVRCSSGRLHSARADLSWPPPLIDAVVTGEAREPVCAQYTMLDRTVDVTGKFLMGAFGEAHNHNIPAVDAEQTIRMYLDPGIFYVMIQTNVPAAPAKLKGVINRAESVDVLFANCE